MTRASAATNTHAVGTIPPWGALRSSDAKEVYSRPFADQYSSVNFSASTPPNPNLAVTEIGSDGAFCYDQGPFASNVILDLAAIIPAAHIDAVDPERLLDTRFQAGLVGRGSSLCVAVPGGVPGDVAVVNITNTHAEGTGWGALRSSDAAAVFARPGVDQYSSVNFSASTPANPNLAVTEIGSDGAFCYDQGPFASNVILDLAAIIPAAHIDAVDPERLLDTRT